MCAQPLGPVLAFCWTWVRLGNNKLVRMGVCAELWTQTVTFRPGDCTRGSTDTSMRLNRILYDFDVLVPLSVLTMMVAIVLLWAILLAPCLYRYTASPAALVVILAD